MRASAENEPAVTHDAEARLARARLALEGLSIGDAFGEGYFGRDEFVVPMIQRRALLDAPWGYTDDTVMALAIFDVLGRYGRIDQDALALEFARRYVREPRRGYGGTAHEILQAIARGAGWREVSSEAFNGQGSMGNGGAMRAAPIGAYFCDDFARTATEARASAEVTHAHPDGQAGAIAVAVAAAYAWCTAHDPARVAGRTLFDVVLDHVPAGLTRDGLLRARGLREGASIAHAAAALGTGVGVVSWDTVPFALFCATRYLTEFEEALWATLSGLGDRDTTCAIVGGIVVLAAGAEAIPESFRTAREPLEFR